MKHSARLISLNTKGLTDKCRPGLVRFGRRDTGVITMVNELKTESDNNGLLFFPLDNVFTSPSTFIGFGTPNTYLVTPQSDATTHKLASFMFWRSKSAVVPTKGRVQCGVLYELCDMSPDMSERLTHSLEQSAGTRGASCAHQVATCLANAGFRFGNGRSLRGIYRPSRFASLLWRHGMSYVDTAGNTKLVKLRIIHASPRGFGDHFVDVWRREADSPVRAVRKQYAKHASHQPAPLFDNSSLPELNPEQWHGPYVEVGIARSNFIGANLAFLIGQKPVYIVRHSGINQVEELSTPLASFPVINDSVTWIKRHVLFSKPVIRTINWLRVSRLDWYKGGLRADMVIDMLKASPGPDYSTAVLYNCVVTGDEIRITGLHDQDERSKKSKVIRTINWIAAKHVLLSGYDPDVVYACELWAYRDATGQPVLCFNYNSGSYRPDEVRQQAFAQYLRGTFQVRVETTS